MKFDIKKSAVALLFDIPLFFIFRKPVNQLCGPGARLIIWEIYVENDTQVKVAQEHGMTRRQLQYSLEKWMRKVFDDADA